MEGKSELYNLEHLISCREALHNKLEERRNLEAKLKARNARHEFILPEGSKEREAVSEKQQKAQSFEDSLTKMLQESYKINSSHKLSEEIAAIKERHPTYWKDIEEIRSQSGNTGQSGQSDQSDQGRPQTREKLPSYDDAYKQPPGQTQRPAPESKQLTEYDRVFQVTTTSNKPSSPWKEQQKPDRGMSR